MDLYLQIGLLFVLAIAFSYYLSTFVEVGVESERILNQADTVVNRSIDKVKHQDLMRYDNNPSISGTDVYALINNARGYGIAVLVQTVQQKGAVINYGYRLSKGRDVSTKLIPVISNLDLGDAMQQSFNKEYAYRYDYLFLNSTSVSETNPNIEVGGNSAFRTIFSASDYSPSDGTLDLERASNAINNVVRGNGNATSPRIYTYRNTEEDIDKPGHHYLTTGSLYTDSVLQRKYNDSFGVVLNQDSDKYLDQNARYYSVFVRDSVTDELLAVYIEQHGVDIRSAYGAYLMLASKSISTPFR